MDLTGLPVDAPSARPATTPGARILLALAILLGLLGTLACGGHGGGRAATVTVPPRIQSFAPLSGVAGETTVTLTGVGFTGFTAVRFGTVAVATAKGEGDTRITVQVPAGATTGAITVVTPRGSHTSAASFLVLPRQVLPPVVSGFQPAEGAPGATVVLTGTGFAGTTQVAFGGAAATEFWERDGVTLEVRVPAGAVTGPLTVVTPAGTGTSQATFTVLPVPVPHRVAPAVTAFTPVQGAPGTRVVITGDHLAGATVVSFNGVASPLIEPQDDRTLAAYVPLGATTGPIAVATPGGTGVSAADFTVLAAPALGITGFDPDHGAPGDLVTVTGTGLAGATEVFFGGVGTVPVGDVTDTHLTAAVPAGAATGSVGVLVPGGIYTSAGDFTVIGGGPAPILPVLTGVNPTHGRPGALVALAGTGLQGTAQVDFGPAAALDFRAVDDTTVLVEVPPMAATGMITLATAAGLAQFGPFTVDPPDPVPAINAFIPVQGAPGTEVTIQGTGLAGATHVTFGGEPAPGLVANLDGSLTAIVPADAVPGPIAVVTPGGFGRSANEFTVLPLGPPAAAIFVPTDVLAGDVLTLFGTGLDQVDLVGFSTTNPQAPYFTDAILERTGPSLAVVVPPQAVTGPLTLVHPGGRVTVPGLLTVTQVAPVITGFEPVEGIPGTEVTLTGRNLANVTMVTFNGNHLQGRFEVLDDTRVRVRMPDQGEADTGGLLAVVSQAGTATTNRPFHVLESRIDAFGQILAGSPDGASLLDYEVFHRAAPYGLDLPTAPVFHPLDPTGDGRRLGLPPSRLGSPSPSYTLGLHLPGAFYAALPSALRHELEVQGIRRDHVAILVASQRNIYDSGGGEPDRDAYEFKPQYWLYPDAPAQGGPDNGSLVVVRLFRPDTAAPGLEENLTLGGAGFDNLVAAVATLGPDATGAVVAGGRAQVRGPVLAPVDFTQSYGFWTLTVAGGEAAATLHLLLNDADQGRLLLAPGLPQQITLDQLVVSLRAQGFTVAEALASLGRPMATPVDRRAVVVADPANPGQDIATGMDQITLQGDMITDVTGVYVNDVPLPDGQVQVDSQAVLRVLVPTGTQGHLQVWTTRGPGDRVQLP